MVKNSKEFKNKRVFIDSAPLIYFIENKHPFNKVLSPLFTSNSKGDFLFITSTITLLEVLTFPLSENKLQLVKQYEDILTNSESIEIIDLNKEIARRAAGLRAKFKLHTPDSIQIATAIEQNADIFLTNDNRLSKIKEIEIVNLNQIIH